MSMEAASTSIRLSRFEQLRFGREVIRQEGDALVSLASGLHDEFCDAIDLLFACQGSVIVTGMGKAGLIGQKITATLASTGTNAHFLHPAEAIHGDLGRIHQDDIVLALSFSGETEEVVRLLPSLADLQTQLVAMTGASDSSLAQAANVVLDLGPIREACPHGLAPSTSTTAMMALGDALALVLSRMRQFGPEDFARFHPGGSLGRKLAKVEDVMRPLAECRVASESHSIRDVFVMASRPGRRTGAIILTDQSGRLTGIFTDSDLAKLLETKRDHALDGPIAALMTKHPTTVVVGTRMRRAIEILGERKISELPVVNDQGKPVGLIDITDVVAFESPTRSTAQAVPASEAADSFLPKTLPLPNRPTG
ncbi:MAG: KpsF/GutQ family sugar-phosphate isomerase [Planctomycetaceae bacterium]|nr:KpsF/GutQ family sugar-phosphate isomerase [Planctomycetales bacterium]MCB9873791.1 KpsF/GutQ family sugar-phosphate isomerase [Planctomycetaceae bacterium]MCB9939718.1 KpsF/GutQ family sugar-phosphate isomerase [Planctomycetaceae bacterium]